MAEGKAARARGTGAEIIGVELVKARASDFERLGGRRGREIVRAKGGKDFADERGTETMGELLIVFFTVRTMPESALGR